MANETKTANIQVNPQEIEFVTRFGENFKKLLDIIGIQRKIRKPNGTTLHVKKANIELQDGAVGEFEQIPYSEANVTEETFGTITLEKFKKGVSLEAIADHGYHDAVKLTDDALRTKLLRMITSRMYAHLRSGTLTYRTTSFQMALAMANGLVINKFDAMDRDITRIVGFANVLDAHEYLGSANITTQMAFGMEYIENFLGYGKLFLMSDAYIPRGMVIATPVENLIDYYINAGDAEFAEAGLSYVTDPLAPFVGFRTNGNYDNASSNRYAIIGNTLMAEYIDGVAVVTIEGEDGEMGSVTVTSAAGNESGESKITVAYDGSDKLYYKEGANAPAYLDAFKSSGWTEISGSEAVAEGLTSGNTLTVVAVNGAGQIVASGTATIVVKA